jgi:hypothetical protein
MSDPVLDPLVACLSPVAGVVAVVLGGSRARGRALASSDYDVGIYYEGEAPLDVAQLRAAILPLVDDPTRAGLTALGGWGPWINGGGWLKIAGAKVDVLYRDLARIRAVIADCRAGRVSMNYQPGHPHGFCSAIWMGEVALCRPLFDPAAAIGRLRRETSPYPAALKEALIGRFQGEVLFSIENAELAAARGEQTHVAGCAYRALICIAQVLFAVNERYLINEKGALAESETFPHAIQEAARRSSEIWAAIGFGDFAAAFSGLRALAQAMDAAVAGSGAPGIGPA